nr:MAG TPA: hypothetical protein [Microviridae sp.]
MVSVTNLFNFWLLSGLPYSSTIIYFRTKSPSRLWSDIHPPPA